MTRIKIWFDKTNKFDFIGYALLLVFFFAMSAYFYNNMQLLTDSDQSSNLIYAKMLLEERTLISNNWYFSTYVDIFNIDKIQALLFMFIDNWNMVHFLSYVVVEIIFFLSFFYVCKKLAIKHIPWLSFLIIGSISYHYYRFAISFNIYAWYMSIGLLSFGYTLSVIEGNNFSIKSVILFLMTFIFSTSGIRNLTALFVPLAFTLVTLLMFNKMGWYNDEKRITRKLLPLSLVIIVSSFLGLVFNKLVLCTYVGNSGVPLGLTRELIRLIPQIFTEVLVDGWLYLSGINDKNVISVFFILVLLFVIYCSFDIVRNRDSNSFLYRMTVVFFVLSSCAVSATFFISSSFSFENRYLLQSFVFLIIIFGVSFNRLSENFCKFLYIIIAIFTIFRTITYANIEMKQTRNQDFIQLSEMLVERGITNGYAEFWNGNILTELSNGEIECWVFKNEIELCSNYNSSNNGEVEIYNWLQKKEHNSVKPDNPYFIIINKSEMYLFNDEEIKNHKIYDGKDVVCIEISGDMQPLIR